MHPIQVKPNRLRHPHLFSLHFICLYNVEMSLGHQEMYFVHWFIVVSQLEIQLQCLATIDPTFFQRISFFWCISLLARFPWGITPICHLLFLLRGI